MNSVFSTCAGSELTENADQFGSFRVSASAAHSLGCHSCTVTLFERKWPRSRDRNFEFCSSERLAASTGQVEPWSCRPVPSRTSSNERPKIAADRLTAMVELEKSARSTSPKPSPPPEAWPARQVKRDSTWRRGIAGPALWRVWHVSIPPRCSSPLVATLAQPPGAPRSRREPPELWGSWAWTSIGRDTR